MLVDRANAHRELCQLVNGPVWQVMQALTLLELEGRVQSLSGERYVRIEILVQGEFLCFQQTSIQTCLRRPNRQRVTWQFS